MPRQPSHLCCTSSKSYSWQQWKLRQGRMGVLRQAQLPRKTDGIKTFLSVCLSAESSEQNWFILPSLSKECCWKQPKRRGLNRDGWLTNAQCTAHLVWFTLHCPHQPRSSLRSFNVLDCATAPVVQILGLDCSIRVIFSFSNRPKCIAKLASQAGQSWQPL